MLKRSLLLIIVLLATSVQANHLEFSPDEKKWIEQHPVVTIGVDPEWPPFEYINDEGQHSGLAADYLQLIGEHIGIEFRTVQGLSWAQVIEKAKSRELDLLPAVRISEERKQYLNFTKPYIDFPMVILIRQDQSFVGGLSGLEGKNVTVVHSYVTHELLREIHPGINLHPKENIDFALKALATGEVDAYVGNLASISYAVNRLGLTNLKVSAVTPYSFPLSLAVRNDWPDLVPILQKALDSVSTAEKNAIRQKWIHIGMTSGYDRKTVLMVVLPIVAIFLTFLLVSLYNNKRLQREVEAKKRSENKYRNLYELANDAILIIDDGLVVDCNYRSIVLFGRSKEKIIGKSLTDFSLIRVGDGYISKEEVSDKYKKALSGVSQRFEWGFAKDNGDEVFADVSLNAVDYDGARHLQAILRDITHQKHIERERALMLEEHTSITNNIEEVLLKLDTNGRLVWWNFALEDVTGLTPEEIEGQYFHQIVSGHDRQSVKSIVNGMTDSPVISFEASIDKDGVGALFQFKSILLKDIRGKLLGYTVVARNVQQERIVEKALSTVIESTSPLTGTGFFQELAKQLASTLEVRYALIGKIAVEDESLIRTIAEWNGIEISSGSTYELAGSPCENVFGKEICVYHDNVQLKFPSDHLLVDMGVKSYAGVPLFDSNNSPIGVLAVMDVKPIKDDLVIKSVISNFAIRAGAEIERIKVEAKRSDLQMQLNQAQKVESIGLLTSGIAHDFNNILSSILGYTYLAKEQDDVSISDELSDYLNEVHSAGIRAKNLISQLLAFGKGSTSNEKHPLKLAVLIKDAVSMMQPMLPSSLILNCKISEDIPAINADPIQIHQLLLNLCVNARDAMNEKGRIDILANTVSIKDQACDSCGETFSGRYLELVVKDAGVGIADQIKGNLFKPFFTTKEEGKGTGMGLSVVDGITHDHFGHIIVNSSLGSGSEFRLLFPVEENIGDENQDIVLESPASKSGKGQRILIVDDEQSIAVFLKTLLEKHDYMASVFTDSNTALESYKVDPDYFDLVITDQTMPGQTGDVLARSMLEMRPELPIILCTGYSKSIDKRGAELAGIKAFMKKPLDPGEMVQTVHTLLNGESELASENVG